MEDKDLDKLFQKAFKEAEEIPRPEVWTQIENKLKDNSRVVPIRKRNNWWTYAAAAAILVSISCYLTSKVLEERSTIKLTANVLNTEKKTSNYNNNIITSGSSNKKLNQDNNSTKQEYLVNYQEENRDDNLERVNYQVELVHIEELAESELIANVKLGEPTIHLPTVRQVTEIDDINPIFEFEEESESMLAATSNESKEKKNIITTLLNNITDNIDSKVNKEVRFHADEEGSFSISILNSIAKNPTKKRK